MMKVLTAAAHDYSSFREPHFFVTCCFHYCGVIVQLDAIVQPVTPHDMWGKSTATYDHSCNVLQTIDKQSVRNTTLCPGE